MKRKIGAVLLFLLLTALLILPDQLTKIWAVSKLQGAEDIVWIPGVFQLHYLENRGMAFGLLQNRRGFLIATTVLVFAAMIYFAWRTPLRKRYLPLFFVLVLLTAGGAGNFIDRLANGYVVDFLYFSLIDFPVFNVADIFVTCSCILLFILILFVYKDEELSALYGREKKNGGE